MRHKREVHMTRRSSKAAFGGTLKITREGIMFRPFAGIVGAFQEHVAPGAFPKWRKVLPAPESLRIPTREDLLVSLNILKKLNLVLFDDRDMDPRDYALVGDGYRLCMGVNGVFAASMISTRLTTIDTHESARIRESLASLRPQSV